MPTPKFKKGQSGNPKGRPVGAKGKSTTYRKKLEEKADEIIDKIIEVGLGGDVACLRMCFDRLIPSYRPIEPNITLKDVTGTLSEQGHKIIKSMGNGEVSTSEAASMLSALSSLVKIIEGDDVLERLERLEKAK